MFTTIATSPASNEARVTKMGSLLAELSGSGIAARADMVEGNVIVEADVRPTNESAVQFALLKVNA